ncbi:MAG: ParB-like nuclease domain-containing protein [Chloroflexi bacterium]|nr:ParB-like nuclease domain-containing protein [Chloroflexota bacterium]MBK8935449.1 ParB-like nuclease domain-containing protein [Chloroflexota bacterium]
MPTTPIQHLKPHPAQMRATYDLEALAALTLQVHERGLDQWQPVVANGQTAVTEAAGYYIISGHRRHMAQLLAFALRDWAAEHPETEISIEVARTMLAALVESLGSLEALVASLLGKYGAEEIPFVLFEGSQKAVSPAGATAVLLNAPHVSPGAIRG